MTNELGDVERAIKKAIRKREKHLKKMMQQQQMDEANTNNSTDMQVDQPEQSIQVEPAPKKKSKKEKKRKEIDQPQSQFAQGYAEATLAAVKALQGQEAVEPQRKKHKKKDKQKEVQPDSIDVIHVQDPSPSTSSAPLSKPFKKSKKSKSTPHEDLSSNLLPSSVRNTPHHFDPTLHSTSTTTTTTNSTVGGDQYMIDPLFNFDYIPSTSSSTSTSTSTAQAQAHSHSHSIPVGTTTSSNDDIQVSQPQPQPQPQEFELPIPPPSFHHHHHRPLTDEHDITSTSYSHSNSEDIPVLGPEQPILEQPTTATEMQLGEIEGGVQGGTGEGGVRKGKKDKEKKEKKSKKKKEKLKEKEKEVNPIDEVDGTGTTGGEGVQDMQIDPQLVELGAAVDLGGGGGGGQGSTTKKKDKGKGKALPSQDPVPSRDASIVEQAQRPSTHGSTSASTSTSASIPSPRPIRVGPVKPKPTTTTSSTDPSSPSTSTTNTKKVFDPTDDSSVLSLEELEKDPEFVKPIKRSGPFWDTLQTKWTPVKELKKLAEDYNESYKQGKFTTSEDRLIKATIKSFRERSGMSSEELVDYINSRRTNTSKDVADTVTSSSSGKKNAGGGGGGATGTTNAYGGPLTEMWQELGLALQERALLSIWNRVKRMYNPDSGKGSWTEEEDERLKEAIKEYGKSSWEKIGPVVGRPSGDCRDRWTKQLGGGQDPEKMKKGKWTKEEEDQLIKLQSELGNSWTAIVKRMGGTRSATQCRIKCLSRKAMAQQTATDTPEPQASTSTATVADQGQDETKEVETTNDPQKAWKWKHEYYSTLVHFVANMKVKNESEIDFAAISDPNLQMQGVKNLRDRFKRLRQSAVVDLQERDNLDEDSKIPYQVVIDHLITQYPEPGKAYKRTYRTAEKKRLEKEKEKEARKNLKLERAKLKEKGQDGDGSTTTTTTTPIVKRRVKSQAIIEESENENENEGDSDEEDSSSDSDEETRSHHRKPEPSIHSKPNPIPLKKGGHGTANWGAANDEILEGVDLARSGDFSLPHSPEMVGAQKLAISPAEEKDEREVAPNVA
ncbi:uncharacterized protein JCM6883_002193 [Sporobolomyces salmoneus]|uniref:uncharacterized protein n=1 Tax=Sporobolomyces salmoneus TaxID=183962 RepID=UPI003182788E